MPGKFIHVLSNASLDEFPSNDPTNFRCRLAEPLFIPIGSYVAVSELSIKYANVTKKDKGTKLDICDWLYPDPEGRGFGKIFTIELPKLELPAASFLCFNLNKIIYEHVPRMKNNPSKLFYYNKTKNRIYVSFEKYCFLTLKLHGELLTMLGALAVHGTPRQYSVVGPTKPDLEFTDRAGNIRHFAPNCRGKWQSEMDGTSWFLFPPDLAVTDLLCLYSNLVEDQAINGSKASLLRFIAIDKVPDGERTTISYGSSLQYIKLKTNVLDEIHFEILDSIGRKVDLRSYSRICLHVKTPEQLT